MSTGVLRILILEDREADAEMALCQLRQEGLQFTASRVTTEADLLAALRQPELDLILGDCSLSSCGGLAALALAQKVRPEVPFIVLSRTAGEETAIDALHHGATDYVLKQRLSRLGPAVRRALRESETARERKRSEESLKLFRTLIDHSNDAIEVVDPESGRFLDVNARGCADLGYSRDEFLTLKVFDIDPRVDAAKFAQVIEKLRQSDSMTWNGVHRRKDGTDFPVEVNLKYARLDRDYLVAVVRDITERKRTEEALAKEQSLLNSLMDHLPDSIYFKDAESRFVQINPAQAGRFGLADPALALGKTDFDFFSKEHAQPAFEDDQQIIRTGQPLVNKEECEVWPGRPDTWVSTTKLPLRDETGRIIGTFGVSRDITKRKRAEQALRESEARYRSLFENLQEGFAYCRMIFERVPEESAPGSTGYQPVPPGDSPDGMGTASEVCPGAAFTAGAAPIPVGESPTGAGGSPAPPISRTCSDRSQPSDFVYLEVNQAFESLTGLKNVVGKRVSEVIPGIQQSNPELFEVYGRVALGGKPERFETFVEPLSIWFSVSVYSPAREHFVAIFDNITERKEHEEALGHRLELQEQLARVAATVPGMIFSLRMRPDGSMCMPFASPALEETYGLQLEDVRHDATPILSLIHPDDFPRVNEAIAESARSRKPWRAEFRVRTRHQGEIWVEGNSMPQLEPDGGILWQGYIQNISERKRTEETMAESRSFLEKAQEVAHLGSWSSGLSPRDPLAWSSEVYRIFGVSERDFDRKLRSFFSLVHPEDRERVEEASRAAIEQGTPFDLEHRIIRPDGIVRWVHEKGDMLRNSDGVPVRMLGVVQDITERKRAEEALSQRASLAALGASVGLALTHKGSVAEILRNCTEAMVQHLDAAFARIWTLNAPEDVLELQASSGMFTHLNGPHSRVPVGTLKIGLIAKERKPHVTNSVVGDPRVGDQEWAKREGMVAFAGHPLLVEGRLVGVAALFARHPLSEATLDALSSVADAIALGIERKRAEEKLRLQSAALDAAANLIVITDREGMIQWVNPAFTAVTGYSCGESTGKTPGELLKSGQHDPVFYMKLWDTILAGGVWHDEIINRCKNDGRYIEDLTITPVRNERGEITHFVGIGMDITEQKKLEEQFLRAQRLDSVGRLAGGIAHDLNNILAPILMMPPLLRQALPQGSAQRLADTIETNAQRGADIVKQMLVFSRGMDGKHLPVQLRTLIRDMLGIIRETFPKNIAARSQLAPQAGMVSGDATQLHQVLMNLCVNARDAMPSSGTLTLGLEEMEVDEAFARTGSECRPGRYVVLSVTDTGTGIPPEALDKIFDPFFTTKEIGEGTGLGLSTVLGIVRSHHGFIQVNSQPGQGTQFRVCLPACELAAAGEIAPSPSPLPQGEGELVLVVDDEDEVRRVTRTILEKNGYCVLEAQNGVEALTVLVSQLSEVKAVVTDLMMPYMDGAAFVRALSHTKSTAKVIVTTGNPTKSRLLDDLQAQVQGFLPKPFRAAALLEMLHQVLHP